MDAIDHAVIRATAAAQAEEAVAICDRGSYTAPSGKVVDLRDLLRAAAEGTRDYPPELRLPERGADRGDTCLEVTGESTLEAARRQVLAGGRSAALNFASATHPGGGFLNGALAQEESLARSSGLYACLRLSAMYGFHRMRHDALYTDYVIYSPDIPVFRGEDGELLEEPYLVSFLTSPAPNARATAPGRRGEIPEALRRRILKVLAAAELHGHDRLVLGAWGCGAFGNDPEMVAGLFHDALSGPFRGTFAAVIFAVRDGTPDRRVLRAFQERFRH